MGLVERAAAGLGDPGPAISDDCNVLHAISSLASSCSDLQDDFARRLQSTETKVGWVRSDQCLFSSSWHASLKARSGSGKPWLIDCLTPENVVFSLA
jgi:hypothetical protein